MEIIVEGKGTKCVTPDLVKLHLNFVTKGQTYEEVLERGVKNVENFVTELLLKYGFQKDDMKTRSFMIKEDTKYNNMTRIYEKDGYSFSQAANIIFDYDKTQMANLMVAISRLENPPICNVNFGVKNEEHVRKEILKDAYHDAEEQAKEIAQAASKTLTTCQKVDFKPFTTTYVSNSMLGTDMMMAEKAIRGTAEAIVNTFTPEDIELTETLYCLWIAE